MIPKSLFRVGLATTDYLVKKSGVLGNQEQKAEFVSNMAGSDVYYLYNKYIEKISPEEFFKLYFNNTISHLSDKNIKQLTLAKRISPTESRDYLAEMYALVSKLMTESNVIESAGSSKCFRHPDGFIFIIEDTPDNVSIYIQSEDLQAYLAANGDMKSASIPGRVTRRFSLTTYGDLDSAVTQMKSDLGSDYNALVKFKKTVITPEGANTFEFTADGPEADMLVNDLKEYSAWSVQPENPIKRLGRAAIKGTASVVRSGARGVAEDAFTPLENAASHFTRNYTSTSGEGHMFPDHEDEGAKRPRQSGTKSFSQNDHEDDGEGNKRGSWDMFSYTYRTDTDIATIRLNDGTQFSRQGKLLRPNLDTINNDLQQIQDPQQIAEYMASKNFQQDQTQPEVEVDPDAPNPYIQVESGVVGEEDSRLQSRTFNSWKSDNNPFGQKQTRSKYGPNSNRAELWDNIVNILDGVDQKEIEWVGRKLTGKEVGDILLRSGKKSKNYSNYKLF